jgi:hypothetical protein
MRITTPGKEGEKPHGRLVWTLKFTTFGDPRFVDLSIMPRLATTDSAIQSQQGATGGAVDDAAVDRFWDAYIDKGKGGGVIGYSDVRRLLTATIAHPQAAGSAPGEAQREAWQSAVNDAGEIFTNADTANRDAIRSRASRVVTWLKANPPSAGSVASPAVQAWPKWVQDECLTVLRNVDTELRATGRVSSRIEQLINLIAGMKPLAATAAGSAPVGVDAKDAARWRQLCELVDTHHPDYWCVHPGTGCDRIKGKRQLEIAIDAAPSLASTKERAE